MQLHTILQSGIARIQGLLTYHEIGEKHSQVVLLIHGLAGTAETHFATLIDALSPEYRIIAPDLRGHGRSRRMSLPCTKDLYHTHATDLHHLIEHIRLQKVHVIGYSDGGEAAILLASMAKQRVQSVVVWGVSGLAPPQSIIDLYTQPEQQIPDWATLRAELVKLHGAKQAAHILRCWSAAMNDMPKNTSYITEMQAASITCPIVIVTGDQDPFNPLPAVRTLADKLPTANLVILSGAGHDLLNERGPQVLALVRRTLSEA